MSLFLIQSGSPRSPLAFGWPIVNKIVSFVEVFVMSEDQALLRHVPQMFSNPCMLVNPS
jgi:hypothetical protein